MKDYCLSIEFFDKVIAVQHSTFHLFQPDRIKRTSRTFRLLTIFSTYPAKSAKCKAEEEILYRTNTNRVRLQHFSSSALNKKKKERERISDVHPCTLP